MHSESSYNMYINQQDIQIRVIILYFSLDALHVSDCISPSSGATSYKLYIAFGLCRYMPIRVAIATQQPHVWYRHIPNAMYSL